MLKTSDRPLSFLVNCSILFTELPLLERPSAAREAGFEAVEFWWPFATAAPPERDVTRFVDAIGEAEVNLIYMNLYAGDMTAGDRGILSLPGREVEFRESLEIAADIGRRLSVRGFNALYGNRQDGTTAGIQYDIARSNLEVAIDRLCSTGAVLLLEALSGAPLYPLLNGSDVLPIIRDCNDSRLGLLADLYHLAVNGEDIDRLIEDHIDRIYHVQIADHPGRHEPGSGELELDRWLGRLRQLGYSGWIGLEYVPSDSSSESLAFLPREQRRAMEAISASAPAPGQPGRRSAEVNNELETER